MYMLVSFVARYRPLPLAVSCLVCDGCCHLPLGDLLNYSQYIYCPNELAQNELSYLSDE